MNRLPTPPVRAGEFSFVLLADRTGMARPGVFERAVEVTNLLRPAFAFQIGDTIEGYTADIDEIAGMWEEIDAITAALDVPYLRIPGNHDVSNETMRRVWLERNGPLHSHFVFDDVLFLMVDTQDPPPPLIDFLRPVGADARRTVPADVARLVDGLEGRSESDVIAELSIRLADEPDLMATLLTVIKDGTQPAHISTEQIAELEQAIAENAGVRWTVVCMHIPAWQGDGHPAVDRLHDALADRPYTIFAGHCHNYEHTTIEGRDHIRLGTSGGIQAPGGHGSGVDHVTLVTMTAQGPRIASIVLDGVMGSQGQIRATDSHQWGLSPKAVTQSPTDTRPTIPDRPRQALTHH